MGEPGTYGAIRAQDHQFLDTNIRAELEANRGRRQRQETKVKTIVTQ